MNYTLPSIVAHRGASEDAPENTITSFKLGWNQKANIIEGDFRLTDDGEIVCFHDENTERITGSSLKIAKSTLDELTSLDVGSWKSPEFSGERIPTLKAVLATVPDHSGIFIEIKCGPEIVPRLREVLFECGFNNERTRVMSFSEKVITLAGKEIPGIKTLWLTKYNIDPETGIRLPSIADTLAILRKTGASGIDSKAHESVDRELVDAIKKEGFEFHVWTVNDLETAERFRHLGVDSITTNRPGWLRKQMKL